MDDSSRRLTRRDFMKTGAGAAASFAVLGIQQHRAFAAGSDTMRVGVIGCGGRGAYDARNCVKSSAGVEIVALADVFADRYAGLQNEFQVPSERCFSGLDAYKKLLALDDINLVILATPPAFRPVQFAAAIKHGKHVFMEKPVAVCTAGVNMVIEAAGKAKEKGLAVVAGTQRRHDPAYIETIKRIHDGAIGDIVSAQCYWNMGGLWQARAKQNWENLKSGKYTNTEWQIRNWLFCKWLSGDHIVEQHIHNIDVLNWAFGALPELIHGMGGRQYRTDPMFGNIYDHFGVEFIYPGDVRTHSMCRQIDGTSGRVGERVVGTKGTSDCCGKIEGENAWVYTKKSEKSVVLEHRDLIQSIRSGEPLNEGKRVAESTLCAIMGREAAYSRMQFKRSWFVKRSALNLLPPADLTLKSSHLLDPIPIPGQYQLATKPQKKA